jgi:NAD-dependent deacetylase
MNVDEIAHSLAAAAKSLRDAKAVAVLTGAGISAESGVATFRGPEGLWRTFRPDQLATPEAFTRDPALVWEWYRWRRERMGEVQPNAGHQALARLERRFAAFTLITQNVDGLHARAGSGHLVELHGNIWRDRCAEDPGHRLEHKPPGGVALPDALPRCHCGALLRPDVVWFGESLDPVSVDAAVSAVEAAQVVLVVGTSSVVYPAAALPGIARRAGATVVEVNPEETPVSSAAHIVLRGLSGVVLPQLERLAFSGG